VSVTCYGAIAREGDIAATYWPRSGALNTAEVFERMIPELPSSGVAVRVGHGGEVLGQMVYGEVREDGRIDGVAIVHDDAILRIDTPIYFSAELLTAGPRGQMTRARAIATHAQLVGLSLTSDPASHGLSALRLRAGDLRDAGHRATWSRWREDGLLVRALEELGRRPRVPMLVRHAASPRVEDGPAYAGPARPRPVYADDGTPIGPTWISATPGRIISVY
jgi:hypothetical protein